jgi:hypothetical protein
MHQLTVISWANEAYTPLSEGLKQDCAALGYPFHLFRIDEEFPTLMKAWCNHPQIIRRGIEEYGTILFLDVECRIVAPIPDDWKVPLISVREPAQHFWIRYNSGTVLADESCLPWIDAWIRVIDEWKLGSLSSDDFIHWPGDLNDEVALAAVLATLNIQVGTVRLEYLDRHSTAPIARGLWRNPHTIIQHPTIHHWIKENDLIECKKLFLQNYPGNPDSVSEIFTEGRPLYECHNWIFDGLNGLYAPSTYWNAHSRKWISDSVRLDPRQR